MKSTKKKTTLSTAFGGLNNLKDWRVFLFAMLAFIAGIASLFKIVICNLYPQIYIPVIWFVLLLVIVIGGRKSFPLIFTLIATSIILTDGDYGYRSLAIFILLILTLGTPKSCKVYITVLFLVSLIKSALEGCNIFDVFELGIQVFFAFFCYYGFIFTSSKAFGHKSKLIYTEKEYKVLYALATQDKTQKEIAYDLGLSSADMGRTMASVKKKNNYETSEALLRQFAIELYLTQKEHRND